MSNTPETDAKASDIIGFFSCATVPAEFARKLEHERDEAMKALSGRTVSCAACNHAAIERDEAREDAAHWKTEYEIVEARLCGTREHLAAIKHYLTKERDDALAQIVQAECRAERFCQERDEAREALENHMAATIHTCHDECKRPMCVLRRERDEARSLVDHYREQKDLLPISWDV